MGYERSESPDYSESSSNFVFLNDGIPLRSKTIAMINSMYEPSKKDPCVVTFTGNYVCQKSEFGRYIEGFAVWLFKSYESVGTYINTPEVFITDVNHSPDDLLVSVTPGIYVIKSLRNAYIPRVALYWYLLFKKHMTDPDQSSVLKFCEQYSDYITYDYFDLLRPHMIARALVHDPDHAIALMSNIRFYDYFYAQIADYLNIIKDNNLLVRVIEILESFYTANKYRQISDTIVHHLLNGRLEKLMNVFDDPIVPEPIIQAMRVSFDIDNKKVTNIVTPEAVSRLIIADINLPDVVDRYLTFTTRISFDAYFAMLNNMDVFLRVFFKYSFSIVSNQNTVIMWPRIAQKCSHASCGNFNMCVDAWRDIYKMVVKQIDDIDNFALCKGMRLSGVIKTLIESISCAPKELHPELDIIIAPIIARG